ncbi:putative lysosomal cobalamin transporter [Dissostichus eleginoides]|uniref:Lysosomal cobalamin transporter n=1 Tax=Dissostichus eleginoides TaxID=100907 RepID=A0AAD9BIK2_DISEL|nr:putative lysosomal cobalamin transporter [Dissostichus eleginoides]
MCSVCFQWTTWLQNNDISAPTHCSGAAIRAASSQQGRPHLTPRSEGEERGRKSADSRRKDKEKRSDCLRDWLATAGERKENTAAGKKERREEERIEEKRTEEKRTNQ